MIWNFGKAWVHMSKLFEIGAVMVEENCSPELEGGGQDDGDDETMLDFTGAIRCHDSFT